MARHVLFATLYHCKEYANIFIFSSSPSACICQTAHTLVSQGYDASVAPATVNCHMQSAMMEPSFLHRYAALAGLCQRLSLFQTGQKRADQSAPKADGGLEAGNPFCSVIQYLLVGRVHRDTPCWCFVFITTPPLCPPHFSTVSSTENCIQRTHTEGNHNNNSHNNSHNNSPSGLPRSDSTWVPINAFVWVLQKQ